jgi:glutamate synthase domain-containing protein 3
MTGGIVVVLGRVGRNFGAGMSNGLAYLLDEDGRLDHRLNGEMVTASELEEDDERLLLRLIREHSERTVSPRARTLLVEWERYRPMFRKVVARGAEELAAGIRRNYLDGGAPIGDPASAIPALARRAS